MPALADALRHANERDIEANEQAIASCFPAPAQMSAEDQQRIIPFINWCQMHGVRPLPARPTSVAAYVQFQQDQGIARELVAERLEAIEALHFAASVGNPVATPVVRTITGASTIDAPRSWAKDDKLAFHELPHEVQIIVARREQDRETALRRAQNKFAEELKQIRKETNDANENRAIQQGRQQGLHDIQASADAVGQVQGSVQD